MTDPDVTAEDALRIAQQALQKANDVDDLEERVDELEERVIQLEVKVTETFENKAYENLTTEEKVGMVREHAIKKAHDGHGKTQLDYSDVKWSVFGGEPGSNHCYRLLRLAAGLESDRTGSNVPGFKVRDPENGNYHLAVNADRVKSNAEFYSRNKTETARGD